jgi:hypothetical protein
MLFPLSYAYLSVLLVTHWDAVPSTLYVSALQRERYRILPPKSSIYLLELPAFEESISLQNALALKVDQIRYPTPSLRRIISSCSSLV